MKLFLSSLTKPVSIQSDIQILAVGQCSKIPLEQYAVWFHGALGSPPVVPLNPIEKEEGSKTAWETNLQSVIQTELGTASYSNPHPEKCIETAQEFQQFIQCSL